MVSVIPLTNAGTSIAEARSIDYQKKKRRIDTYLMSLIFGWSVDECWHSCGTELVVIILV